MFVENKMNKINNTHLEMLEAIMQIFKNGKIIWQVGN